MSRFIDNCVRCLKRLLHRFVEGNRFRFTPLNKRKRKRINQWLFPLLMVAIISACNNAAINRGKKATDKPPSIDCHIVQHEMGKTCIPRDPRRIITIPFTFLGNILALDIKPVGSTLPFGAQKDLSTTYISTETYLGNRTEEIKSLGATDTPNLEKILSLKPDLILAWGRSNSVYSQLSQIAPTVIVPYNFTKPWQHSNFIADALEKEETARQAKEDYYRRVEELKMALGDQYQDKEISVVAYELGGFVVYLPNSFPGSILEDLGLKRPTSQNIVTSGGTIKNISEERPEMIGGDILFVLMFGKEDKEKYLEELQPNPLWQKVKAVQSGQVYLVEGDAWVGSNLLAAHAVLDDIKKYLVDTI